MRILWQRTLSILITSALFLQALAPAALAVPAPAWPSAPTSTDQVWGEIYLEGHSYELHAVVNTADATLAGRALDNVQDAGNVLHLYALQDGAEYYGPEAERAFLLVQGARRVYEEVHGSGVSMFSYIASGYVESSFRTPFLPCYGDPGYESWSQANAAEWWRNMFIYNDFDGLNCYDYRVEMFSGMLLDAALQPDFADSFEDEDDLLLALADALEQIEPGEIGFEVANFILEEHTYQTLSSASIDELLNNPKLGHLVNTHLVLNTIGAVVTLVGTPIKFRGDAVEKLLLWGIADQRAYERLQALDYFITNSQADLDPALVEALDKAWQLFYDYRIKAREGWSEAIYQTLAEDPLNTVVSAWGMTKALSTVLETFLHKGFIPKALGKVMLPYVLSYYLYKGIRVQEQNAQRGVLAASLQRKLFSDATGVMSLRNLSQQVMESAVIDGAQAEHVIRLAQINTYLSWAFYRYDEEIFGNFATTIWGVLGDFFLADDPYSTFMSELRTYLSEARQRHEDELEELLLTPAGSGNAWLVGQVLDAPLQPPPLPDEPPEPPRPGVSFTNPQHDGQSVSGSLTLEAAVQAESEVSAVEFTVRTPSGFLMHSCTDTSLPYQCAWDTTTVIWDGARYELQAVAHTADGSAGSAASWAYVDNSNYNYPPSLVLRGPDGESAYEYYVITWEDDDPDDNALISLYYDTDNSGFDGQEIITYFQEDWNTDRYTWRIPDSLPAGPVWIYAVIDDGANPAVRSYSPGPLRITYPTQQASFSLLEYELEEAEGDGDGVPDAGEELELSVRLHNDAAQDRVAVRARLSSPDHNLELDDDTVRYNLVPAGGDSGGRGDFDLRVAASYSATVPLELEVFYQDAGGTEFVDKKSFNVQIKLNDQTPPLITTGPSPENIAPDAATITWSTNEPASAAVEYGLTTAYGSLVTAPGFATDQMVALRGLDPGKTYYYRVLSQDTSGNGPVSASGQFATPNLGSGLHVNRVDYPNLQNIFGLTWDGTNLWILWRTNISLYHVVRYDITTRTVLSSFPVDFMPELNNSARGLAWDGTYLYITDRSAELIYRVTTAGALVAQYDYPGQDPNGITWDGSSFWVSDSETLEICQLNASLQVVTCFPSPGLYPTDLAWDGTYLWNLDANSMMLYQLTQGGTRLNQYPYYNDTASGLTYQPGAGLWGSLDVGSWDDALLQIALVEDSSSPLILSGPVATSDSGTSALVTWETDEPSDSAVVYHLGGTPEITTTVGLVVQSHEVALENLQPNQSYTYHVCSRDLPGNEPTCSAETSFQTAGLTELNVVHSIFSDEDADGGITYANGFLWVKDRTQEYIYKVDPVTGQDVGYLEFSGFDSHEGLTWDGAAFWMGDDVHAGQSYVRRVDPNTGSVLRSIPYPDSDLTSVAWDGTLWGLDEGGQKAYRLDPANGAVLSTVTLPWPNLYGIATGGGSLWFSSRDTNTIYRTSYAGDLLGAYPSPGTLGGYPALHWQDDHLWVVDDEWRFQLALNPTYAPVVAKVTVDNLAPAAILAAGSAVTIQAFEQYARPGYTATLTITSLTDDPGIVDVPMQDLGNGWYAYTWNTAGQQNASDYLVEVRMTDSEHTDSDGLSATPDARVILAPTLTPLETYPLNVSVVGATFAGSNLWVTTFLPTDGYSQVELASGNPLVNCAPALSSDSQTGPQGITWDGSYLWISNDYWPTPEITRHTTSCGLVSRFNYPGLDPSAVQWDGSHLWVTDSDGYYLYQMTTTGGVVNRYGTPGDDSMTFDGSRLWIAEANRLYGVDRATGVVVDYRYLAVGGALGLAWNGSSFYQVASGAVYRLGYKPDLALGNIQVASSQVPEGQNVPLSVTAYAHDLPAQAIVNFYLGDPDAGGVPLGSSQDLGTVAPGAPATALLDWSTTQPGSYTIYARVDAGSLVDESNEINNTVALTLEVYDTDVEAPVIGPVEVLESIGDGDGLVEDDEVVQIAWEMSDDSGIGAASVLVDGVSYPATLGGDGRYQAIFGPLPYGYYDYTITASDGDNTPETATQSGEFMVYPHAPDLVGAWPPPGSGGVDTSVEISSTFDVEMSVAVGQASGALQLASAAEATFVGEVSYDPSDEVLLLDAYRLLEPGTTYTVTLPVTQTLTDELGNPLEDAQSWTFTTAPDALPPWIAITSHSPGATVSGVVDLLGVLEDHTAATYELAFGAGAAPADWSTINTAESNGLLDAPLGSWDTTELPNGLYTLRYTAEDQFGNQSQLEQSVTISNTIPHPGLYYASRWMITYTSEEMVEVVGYNFRSYAAVYLDGIPVDGVEWVDSTTLRFPLPDSLPLGLYDIAVANSIDTLANAPGALAVTTDQRGDCNADLGVDAGDLSALVLEVFDGDGDSYRSTFEGDFGGDPRGCDANNDVYVDAGDLSCTVLTIFNGAGACTSGLAAWAPPGAAMLSVGEMPALALPGRVSLGEGGILRLPVEFQPGSEAVSSLAFSLDYDPAVLGFDPTDHDGDGLPDAIQLALPPSFTGSVMVDAADASGELDIVIFDPGPPLAALDARSLLWVSFSLANPQVGQPLPIQFGALPPPSFGSVEGSSLPGTSGGSPVLVEEVSRKLFFPLVVH